MYYKERSLLYYAYLLYKLSELQKRLKEYIILLSSAADSTNAFSYNHDIQTQSEIIDPLKQFIEEINISKVFPDYLLQLKIQRSHEWTGRGLNIFFLQES